MRVDIYKVGGCGVVTALCSVVLYSFQRKKKEKKIKTFVGTNITEPALKNKFENLSINLSWGSSTYLTHTYKYLDF